MVTARRFEDLGLSGTSLEEVEQLTRRSRTLEVPEIAQLANPRTDPAKDRRRSAS